MHFLSKLLQAEARSGDEGAGDRANARGQAAERPSGVCGEERGDGDANRERRQQNQHASRANRRPPRQTQRAGV